MTYRIEGLTEMLRGRPVEYGQSFEWTTTPPTEEGLYWIQTKSGRRGLYLEADRFGLYSEDWRLDELISSHNITHWLGPLPVPEPPRG